MFTGLIEKVGKLESITQRGNGLSVTIACDKWQDPLEVGESIAVNGTCLTVTEVLETGFSADVLKETIDRTSLKTKRKGSGLNLERALKTGDRLGGHIVSGHIDGVGTITSLRRTGEDYIVRTACSTDLMREIVEKGSVALEGISLTVSATGSDWFEVNIIPHTWRNTSLAACSEGDPVNIETDIIAKYVRKLIDPAAGTTSILDRLNNAGFPTSGN